MPKEKLKCQFVYIDKENSPFEKMCKNCNFHIVTETPPEKIHKDCHGKEHVRQSLAAVAVNFGKEYLTWKYNGSPVRSDERVIELYDKVCSPCTFFSKHPQKEEGICTLCRCPLAKDDRKRNKLRYATTSCPDKPPRFAAEHDEIRNPPPQSEPCCGDHSEQQLESIEQPLTFFQESYVLNLNSRMDRMDDFYMNIDGWPFSKPYRIGAINGSITGSPPWWQGNNGAWGCYRSHLNALEVAMHREVENYFVFEDDAILCEDFNDYIKDFVEHVPDDWDMIYLGGQHLNARFSPPVKVNEHVYRGCNINRTHAFAVNRRFYKKLYQYLTNFSAWKQPYHIDHHLGRLHETGKYNIYCPRLWLIGQSDSDSDIANRWKSKIRFWKGAEKIKTFDRVKQPYLIILGLHSSGSSCIAGILHHLGVHLGLDLGGYYGKDPLTSCGFEAKELTSILEHCIGFPDLQTRVAPDVLQLSLSSYLNRHRTLVKGMDVLGGSKYPLLCACKDVLLSTLGENLYVINCQRSLDTCIASLQRRSKYQKITPERLAKHQRWLWEGKQEILNEVPYERSLNVWYDDVLDDSEKEVDKIIDFLQEKLDRAPTTEQREVAIRYPDPARCHFTKASPALSNVS